MNIAIIGATGAVGEEMISILEERNFPVQELFLYASESSAGEIKSFNNQKYIVKHLSEKSLDDFDTIDIALFSAGSEVSQKFIPLITERGTVCIDNSNAWRMDPDVPLIVPEVNYADLVHYRKKKYHC